MSFILFLPLALVATAAAAGVVVARKPVHSALFLLLNFATLAVMYIGLNAQFLAAVQIIVYAGAIVVLFLFVIMLLGWHTGETVDPSRRWTRYLSLVLGAVLLVEVVYVVSQVILGTTIPPAVGAPGSGSAQAIGEALYTSYLLPFEITSVLLLVGIVGAIVLSRRPSRS